MEQQEKQSAIDLSTAIYDFINSPDCARHAREIGRAFEPLEMADIILRSNQPMMRRHRALEALLADRSAHRKLSRDCYGGTYLFYEIPFYQYIHNTLEFERTEAERFSKPQRGWVYLFYWNAFSTLSDALSYALRMEETRGEIFYIIKQRLNQPDMKIVANVDKDGTILSLEPDEDYNEPPVQTKWNAEDSFIDRARIPTPFMRGDIVRCLEYRNGDLAVVDDTTPGRESVYQLDMFTFGWHIEHKDLGKSVVLSDYDSFSGELRGGNRVLSYLSDFLSGKIRLDEYEDAVRAMGKGGKSAIFIPDVIVI